MLFVALGKVSKVAERNLNHATQMTEINVNKAVKELNEATTKMSKILIFNVESSLEEAEPCITLLEVMRKRPRSLEW